MTKINFKDLEKYEFQEASISYINIHCPGAPSFAIELLVYNYFDNIHFLFKFKNAEIYLPRIRTDLSGIVFDKEGNLVFCGWGGMEGDNQKIIFFNEPDYKTEMEIYKLTEEESKQYYYV
jgi:hypothetical protein